MKILVLYSDGDMEKACPFDNKGRKGFCQDITQAIRLLGHEAIFLNAVDDFLFRLKDMTRDVDLIFNIADEGYDLNSQLEPHIPAILDIIGIPYTGSDYMAIGTCLDKVRTKEILISNSIATPKYISYVGKDLDDDKLRYPLIIKPSREDGSIGIKNDSVVFNKKDLKRKAEEVFDRYDQPILIEEFLDGKDISCAIIGNKELEVLPLREMTYNLPEGLPEFFTYDAKWDTESRYYDCTEILCPADIDEALKEEIINISKKAYALLGLKGYGRIDFRLDRNNIPFILEVNPNPDLSKDNAFSIMASCGGISYSKLIEKIINYGLETKQNGRNQNTEKKR